MLLNIINDNIATRKAGYSDRLSAQSYLRNMLVLTSMLQWEICDHYATTAATAIDKYFLVLLLLN